MTLNLNKTSEEHAQLINELASKSLADHVLTHVDGRWTCARADRSSMYSFNLRFEPGMVVIWGDLGEFVLRHSDSDSIAWFVTAGSRDYVLGKVVACDGSKRRFCYGDAIAHLDQMVKEAENDRDEDGELTDVAKATIVDVEHVRGEMAGVEHDCSDEQHRVWCDAWGEVGDWDPPQCATWEPGLCWLWEMREKFRALFWARLNPGSDLAKQIAPTAQVTP
jgi:hypothetical protein